MTHFLQGLTMGLAYVAPIGVQNLFVINTALTKPRRRALGTAFVVIFFDVTLALACFFGAGAVMARYPGVQRLILLVGSLVVLAIGIGLLRTKEATLDASHQADTWIKTVSKACVVTWFNPQAIIDGTMMLGAFRAALPGQSAPFILGVAVASTVWFSGVSLVLSVFGKRFNAGILRKINLICGAVVVFYGCKLLWQFLELAL